jgi:ZIP family zinc transporter
LRLHDRVRADFGHPNAVQTQRTGAAPAARLTDDGLMAAAFAWGTLAASSLVIGALVALLFRINLPTIGLIMGFGAGVLISAVAFDLVEEAAGKASGHGAVIAGIFAGCGVFFGGDSLIDRWGGADRKDAAGAQASGSALAMCSEPCSTGSPSRW